MLTIYQWVDGSLREVVTPDGPCWINLADPSSEEILRVQTLTGVSREFLSDPLDRDERPRLDVDDDGTVLIVVHVPYHEPNENLHPFNTLPLGVVHTSNAVITVCNRAKVPLHLPPALARGHPLSALSARYPPARRPR